MVRYITYALIAIAFAFIGGAFALYLQNQKYVSLQQNYQKTSQELEELKSKSTESQQKYKYEIDKLKNEIYKLGSASPPKKNPEKHVIEKRKEESVDDKIAKLAGEIDWDWYTKTWMEFQKTRQEAFKKQDETIINRKFLDKNFYKRFLEFQDKTNEIAKLLEAEDPVDLMSNPKVASKLTLSFLKNIGINLTPEQEGKVEGEVEKLAEEAKTKVEPSEELTTLDKLYIYGQQTVTFADYLHQTLSPEQFAQYMLVINGDPFFGMPSIETQISGANAADVGIKVTDFWFNAFAFDETKKSTVSNIASEFAVKSSNLIDSNMALLSTPTLGLLTQMKQTVNILGYQIEAERKIPTAFNFAEDELDDLNQLSGKIIKLTIVQ